MDKSEDEQDCDVDGAPFIADLRVPDKFSEVHHRVQDEDDEALVKSCLVDFETALLRFLVPDDDNKSDRDDVLEENLAPEDFLPEDQREAENHAAKEEDEVPY